MRPLKAIKIMTVFGTRPEATKMAPVIKTLMKYESIRPVVCVTAQHRNMLDQVLDVFGIKPDHDLNIMRGGQGLSDILARAVKGLEEVMIKERPDLVLVHGDTSTTFAGAVAAFYQQIKVGHVEAGLRTYDKYQPFPEEMNRQLTTRIADLHFAPTALSRENLLKENIPAEKIFVTGNTAIDCLSVTISDDYKFNLPLLNAIDYKNKRVIAMTAHRRENLGRPLEDILTAARDIIDAFPDTELVYAAHLNPAVQEPARRILSDHPRVHLTDPIDMDDMHNLMARSYLILTDSGGIQEEAPSLDKPVVVLRNVTERPEGLAAGTLKLAGNEYESVRRITSELLNDRAEYEKLANAKNPFGDGNAAERIVKAILYSFGSEEERPIDYI
ncbi:MAG: UDP-N-acetylglucosamine 2-epimerase (non-hydrolyzing) [Defluviitaleaceae bacterium]|nr:UDP-N-acetylglucosamine 2-epimerase (non-hydrolyzing) [Defluviitaleaceae bacterium]